jgi:UDP-GlcNAc:undecaprenyl-phosphate GlcNAc-1-phosphate transferase
VSVALAVAAGFLSARLLWRLTRGLFSTPVLQRENYRGLAVPTGAGVLLALVALMVEAGRASAASLGAAGQAPALPAARLAVLLAVTGFALLGFLDDVAGDGSTRGLRGHLRALSRGQLTTGVLKLGGGAALAVAAVAAARPSSVSRLLIDGAVVALGANLGNLLDRAPGRAIKVSSLVFVGVAVGASAGGAALGAVAVVAGAALALLPDDLRERLMLGDAGANALGAALALGLVLGCSSRARDLTLVVLVVLTAAAEVVSFSRVIQAVAPLRALDRAGRRPA